MIQSYLLYSKQKELALKKAQEISKLHAIDPFDITHIDLISDQNDKKSIGIEDIRKNLDKLYLKPIRSDYKATIIYNAHLLTNEAQNALLKTLEEPPNNTLIFLIGETKESFIPTILSRVSAISLDLEKREVTDEEKKDILLLSEIPTKDALIKAQVLAKSKADALKWIESQIFVIHDILLKNPENKTLASTLQKLQKTHTTISKTNTNLRLTLEYLLLSI